jgi:hypothetical protein
MKRQNESAPRRGCELLSAQPAEVVAKLDKDPTGPIDWAPDAQFAVVQGEVWNVTNGGRVSSRLPHFLSAPRFSPDHKWLAYESADGEIVCQDFPAARTRIGQGEVFERL